MAYPTGLEYMSPKALAHLDHEEISGVSDDICPYWVR